MTDPLEVEPTEEELNREPDGVDDGVVEGLLGGPDDKPWDVEPDDGPLPPPPDGLDTP